MPSRNRTNKRKIRKSLKTRRRKQKGGGKLSELVPVKPVRVIAHPLTPSNGTITEVIAHPLTPSAGTINSGDILFQDADVCILKPDVKKGILVFTAYTQPAGMSSLCEAGLKTGERLRNEGLSFFGSNSSGRKIHPYIFFRAPFESTEIDYTSVDDEIKSIFGESAIDTPGRVWIRVDPEQTYVYSSEIRDIKAGSPNIEEEVNKSRMKMTDFLHQLTYNVQTASPGYKLVSNLYNYRIYTEPITLSMPISYPLIEGMLVSAEVLVRVPHLTSNYFVKCTPAPASSSVTSSSLPVSSLTSSSLSASASASASAPAPAPYTLQWCNFNGSVIGKCESCGAYSCTKTDIFYHKLGCPRIRTQPDLSSKPVTTEGLITCVINR